MQEEQKEQRRVSIPGKTSPSQRVTLFFTINRQGRSARAVAAPRAKSIKWCTTKLTIKNTKSHKHVKISALSIYVGLIFGWILKVFWFSIFLHIFHWHMATARLYPVQGYTPFPRRVLGHSLYPLPLNSRSSTQKAPRDTLVYLRFCSFLRRFFIRYQNYLSQIPF